MISHSHKFIFVHVPRCGGISMRYALRRFKPRRVRFHMPASEWKKTDPPRFNDYFTFSFVRNPWDRVLSDYFWHLREGGFKQKDFNREDFLKHIKTGGTHPWSQWWMVSDGKKVIVDFVGKFENINEDWAFVAKKLGLPQTLSHRNKTKHKHYSHYYDEETKKAVVDRFPEDIEKFGYKFEDKKNE